MSSSSTAARPAGLPEPVGRQSDVIYLDADRDQVVLGTAGSGKTLMAVYRAVYLADSAQPHSGRTLLVTFTRALKSYLDHLVGEGHSQVDVRNYHKVATGYLNNRGLMTWSAIAQYETRDGYVRAAIEDVRATYSGESRFFDRPLRFFLDELDWISGHGHTDRARYLAAERRGRSTPLNPSIRNAMWSIRERYFAHRSAGGHMYDWGDLSHAVIAALDDDVDRPRLYKHIVIDEGQDLPPSAVRSLVKMLQPGGTITLFADYAQQLYGQRASWADYGLRITQPELFQENYRNSAGIARLAIATAALPHFNDSTDLVEPNAPAAAGVAPTLVHAASRVVEVREVQAAARQFSATGTVAILTRTRAEARGYLQGLPYRQLSDTSTWSADPGIYAGTYFAAKGLEFDVVIMPGLDSTSVPDESSIEIYGEGSARERAASQLYVGITRARAELIGTYTDEFTDLLPASSSGHWIVVKRA